MDLQKEREAFEAVTNIYHCIYNADLNYYFSGSKFVGDKAEIEVNAGWKAWQAKAQAVPKWFVAKEIKPVEKDPGEKVLTWDKVNGMRLVPVWSFKTVTDVTHWMPLPDAPQEPAND